MYYQVSGLKNIKSDQQLQVRLLIESVDSQVVKEIFQYLKIIVLGLQVFEGNIADFGKYKAQVIVKEISYNLILSGESFESVVELLLELGFDVQVLNMIDESLSVDYISTQISTIKQSYFLKQQEFQKNIEMQKQQEEKKFDDEVLKKLQIIVNQTLQDIDDLLKKVEGTTSSVKIKNLKKLQEDLKKLRLGTNSQKMTELLDEIYTSMEEIDLDYLEYLKNNEFTVLKKSFVSNVDVEGEYDKYTKAQKVLEVGVNQNSDDKYYIFFGKWGMYQKFLRKDFQAFFSKINEFLYGMYDFFIDVTYIVAVFMVFFILFYGQTNLFIPLLHVGILGTILSLISYVRKLYTLYLLLGYVVLLGGYFLIVYALKTSFAL